MPATIHDATGASRTDVPPETVRDVRRRTVRRIVRILIWSGLVLLGIGFVVAAAAGGASVPATVVLSAGLIVEAVGLVAYRMLFWASVFARDRPKTARKVRKSGP